MATTDSPITSSDTPSRRALTTDPQTTKCDATINKASDAVTAHHGCLTGLRIGTEWVAFRFDNAMREKQVARKDYSIRPQYPKDPLCTVTTSNDASFSGYDHGHLCASADRLCSRLSNDQTFYMSNMSPQMGDFNQLDEIRILRPDPRAQLSLCHRLQALGRHALRRQGWHDRSAAGAHVYHSR